MPCIGMDYTPSLGYADLFSRGQSGQIRACTAANDLAIHMKGLAIGGGKKKRRRRTRRRKSTRRRNVTLYM